MRSRRASFDAADVQHGMREVDLIPLQVDQFARPKPVPIGYQDHGCVPVAPAVPLGRVDKGVDFDWRQEQRVDCPHDPNVLLKQMDRPSRIRSGDAQGFKAILP